jgi:hypothetical protein
VELDPLIAARDERKPLASKLLAVPALRERYLGLVREIAEKWLDWKKLGPIVERYQSMIAEDVKLDTRKLYSTDSFARGIDGVDESEGGGFGGPIAISLKNFAEKRREYLLQYREEKKPEK